MNPNAPYYPGSDPSTMRPSTDPVRSCLVNLHIPRWNELPSIPLYMDQVIQYLNDWLYPLNFDSPKPLLTSSMVNNYVKTSILKKPERKQYKNYHLAYLIVVALMKRAYSLSEISSCIEIYSDIENADRIAQDYNKFVSIFEACLKEIIETHNLTREYFSDPTPQQYLMSNVIRTLVCKIYVQWQLGRKQEPPFSIPPQS